MKQAEYDVFISQCIDVVLEKDISYLLGKILLNLEDRVKKEHLSVDDKQKIIYRLYNLCVELEDYPENYPVKYTPAFDKHLTMCKDD